MNVKITAGGVLAYDSRIPAEKGYNMESIRVYDALNKGGTATLVLPPQHPLREGFAAFRTEVCIYRNGALRWRGRPLPHSGDKYNRRTIVCEGELCFLQDATLRPCSIIGELSTIFTTVIEAYNSTVETWKKFVIGDVTVTTSAAVTFTNKTAQSVFAVVQNLIKSHGGYIIFDSLADGTRRINWYATLPYSCNQRIKWGYNLTDYSASADTTDFATRIVPYGAIDKDGSRLTINVDGKDYVENADAVAVRGVIEIPKIYSGIADAEELLATAQADVDRVGVLPETIQLSALDLSRQDSSLDAFRIGQRVAAESEPHNMAGLFDLASIEEDLIDAGVGKITLIQEAAYYDGAKNTLSGSVSQDNKAASERTSEMESYADSAAQAAVDKQTPEDVLNKLTDDGKIQGIYVQNHTWYINAEVAKIINLKAENIDTTNLKVAAANITGTLTASQINGDGLTAKNATISGVLTAGSGSSIGGLKSDSNSIYFGAWSSPTPPTVFMSTGSGYQNPYTICGRSGKDWCFGAGTKFGVTNAGVLYGTDVHLSGEINAKSGKVGDWNVGEVSIYDGTVLVYSGTALYSNSYADPVHSISMTIAMTPTHIYAYGRNSDGASVAYYTTWTKIINAVA